VTPRAAGVTRILGIDPGLRVTGFGVIDCGGGRLAYVTSGCIRTPSGADLGERLKAIYSGLGEIIAEARPQQFAIEQVFVNTNPKSTLLLGQARGAAICAALMHDLPLAEYTALQVKQAVVGNGHAVKDQVQAMVKRLLALAGNPSPDAADALACAICHAHGGQGLGRTRVSAGRARGLGKLETAGYRIRRGRIL